MADQPTGPREITIPGAHALILPVVTKHVPPGPDVRVLDLGAGEGAMSKRLLDAGYHVSACDLFPDMFSCPGVDCRKADLHRELDYRDASFDLVLSVEVVEHLESQLALFKEVARILRPGGAFIFTTPNIASFKSRLAFLFTGFFYSHGPLDIAEDCPVSQHIAAFTPNRYRFILHRAGFDVTALDVDKYQRTSLWLAPAAPLVRWCARRKHGSVDGIDLANSPAALFGRSLVVVARKRLSQSTVESAGRHRAA